MSQKFSLPQHLLWEYDLAKFDYEKHYRVAIERIIERGTLEQWQEGVAFYGREKFLEVGRESPRLNPRNRRFTELAMRSKLMNHDFRPGRHPSRDVEAAKEAINR